MASPQPALRQAREHHLHVASEPCPVCDQPIPNEKAQEVRARMEARDRDLTEAAHLRAAQEFARDKAQIEADANAAVENARKQHADALEKITQESAAREAAARAAGKKEADAALQEKLAAAEQAKAEAEAALQERVGALEQAANARDADWQDKVAAVERDKQGAIDQYEALKANQDKVISESVQDARDALEKAHANELGTERAKRFAETQKLRDQLGDVTRRLEKKTAEELGEGAEINLFETLKAEFDSDRIERIGKGESGADIIHTVMHNDRECGRIIYDSKNTSKWYHDYVRKLVQDRTAAKAEHAILCTLKFPGDTRQLELRDGVIIVNPARVVALVQIIRKHIIQVHRLRLSRSEREKKMAALYDFITSERCGHLLVRFESHSEALLKLQEKEIKAHEAHWRQEGLHLRSIQKVKAELESEIDQIIGTHHEAE